MSSEVRWLKFLRCHICKSYVPVGRQVGVCGSGASGGEDKFENKRREKLVLI